MKYLIAIAFLILLICAAIVMAEGSSVIIKLTCPICGKEIKDGSFISQYYKDGQCYKVHFQHAFDNAFKDRFASLKKK